jgi:hypothetical protein
MRFYLAAYVALIAGAFVALAVGGVLPHLSVLTVLVAFGGAIALGLLLAFVWYWHPEGRQNP